MEGGKTAWCHYVTSCQRFFSLRLISTFVFGVLFLFARVPPKFLQTRLDSYEPDSLYNHVTNLTIVVIHLTAAARKIIKWGKTHTYLVTEIVDSAVVVSRGLPIVGEYFPSSISTSTPIKSVLFSNLEEAFQILVGTTQVADEEGEQKNVSWIS